jgi:hypothetical protein
LVANGSFALGTAAALTNWGPNATNATLSVAAAATLSAASPWTGRGFSYKLNTANANGQYSLYGANVTRGVGFKAGDRLRLTGRLSVSAFTLLNANSGFNVFAIFDQSEFAQPLQHIKVAGDYAFSQEFYAPSAGGDLSVQSLVMDVGTYVYNNFTLTNETAMDAIWKPGVQVIGDVFSSNGLFPSDTTLLSWAYAQSFSVTAADRDATTGLITRADIEWPDGALGEFRCNQASAAFAGEIDGWEADYRVAGGGYKTVVQPTVTRNAKGQVTAQPPIWIYTP